MPAGAYSVIKVLVPGRGPMVGRLRVQGVVALKLRGSGHLARLEISRSELPGQVLPVGLPLQGLLEEGDRSAGLLARHVVRREGAHQIDPSGLGALPELAHQIAGRAAGAVHLLLQLLPSR